MSGLFVIYRFLHETDSSKKYVKIETQEITAKNLKQYIAKATGLEFEFKKSFDFKIFVQESNDSLREITDDTEKIKKCTQVVVQRCLKSRQQNIRHDSTREINADATKISSLPFPREYLCSLCGKILLSPVVIRCASKCGKTACKACVDSVLNSEKLCPFCREPMFNVVPNKTLTGILAKLNLRDFDLRFLENSDKSVKSDIFTPSRNDEIGIGNIPSGNGCQMVYTPTELARESSYSTKKFNLAVDCSSKQSLRHQKLSLDINQKNISPVMTTNSENAHVDERSSSFDNRQGEVVVFNRGNTHVQGNNLKSQLIESPAQTSSETMSKGAMIDSAKYVKRFSKLQMSNGRRMGSLIDEDSISWPFRTLNDLACLFPLISREDFILFKSTQLQIKALQDANS